MTRIGIVGAGITGLALHHYLAEQDIDSVVFETNSSPGGAIRTTTEDDRILEHGPQRLRLTPTVNALISRLGIADEIIRVDTSLPLYVYADGKLRRVPRSISEFLHTDLLSSSGKLRILAEPLTGQKRTDETVADLFARKFGTQAYRNLFGPLIGGMYGSDPHDMPMKYVDWIAGFDHPTGSFLIPALRRIVRTDSTPAASFTTGLQRLPIAIAESHTDRIHFETPVTTITEDVDGFEIETTDDTTLVDQVVITCDAFAAAQILTDLAPASADALTDLTYNSLVLVHLDAEIDQVGFGYQIRPDSEFVTLGTTWNSSLFDRDNVVTCFLGGCWHPDITSWSTDELGAVATREFHTITGTDASVLNVTRLEKAVPAYDRSWIALDRVALPPGVFLATNYTDRLGIPSRIRHAKALSESLSTSPAH